MQHTLTNSRALKTVDYHLEFYVGNAKASKEFIKIFDPSNTVQVLYVSYVLKIYFSFLLPLNLNTISMFF